MIYFKRTTSDCGHCPLDDRRRVNGSCMISSPRIILLGEAPGEEEENFGIEEGKPAQAFVGGAGRTLNYALGEVNLPRKSVVLLNTINCRPPANDIKSPEGFEARGRCKFGLEDELVFWHEKGAKVIVALGNTAMNSLGIEGKIGNNRGSVYPVTVKEKEFLVVPTYHPSFIMRGAMKEEPTWLEDFEKAIRISKEGWAPPKEDFVLFPTLGDVEHWVKRLVKAKARIGVDIETTSLHRTDLGKIWCIGIAESESSGIVIPFYRQGGFTYWKADEIGVVKSLLRKLFASCDVVIQNALFDVGYLEYNGMPVKGDIDDILLLHHAIHPELPHRLGYIVSIYGDTPYWKDVVLDSEEAISNQDDTVLRTYNIRDSVVLLQVKPKLEKDLDATGTRGVYEEISKALLRPVLDMRANGLLLDTKRLEKWRRWIDKELKGAQEALYGCVLLPQGFSFDSPQHLHRLLYGVLPQSFEKKAEELAAYDAPGSKRKKDTKAFRELSASVLVLRATKPLWKPTEYYPTTDKGNPSADDASLLGWDIKASNRLVEIANFKKKDGREEKAAIEELKAVLQNLKDFRKFSKLKSTYTTFPTWKDGKVHASFNITGTATGRLSSDKPNMQNLPEEAMKLFVPGEGNCFVGYDFSSIEVVMLAYVSEDEVLIRQLKEGLSPHTENANILIRVVLEGAKVTPEFFADVRFAMKKHIFGTIYGGSAYGVYEQIVLAVPKLNLTFAQYETFRNAWLSEHPRYGAWASEVQSFALENRYVETVFGRKRFFLGDDGEVKREALNTSIQSPASDVASKNMVRIYWRAKKEVPKAEICLTIHDALYFRCPKEDAKKMLKIFKEETSKPFIINGREVIFPIEVKGSCDSLGEMKKEKEFLKELGKKESNKNAAAAVRRTTDSVG